MSVLSSEWKSIRPQVSEFINKVDGILAGCNDVETMIAKKEQKAFEKAYEKAKQDIAKETFCNDCDKREFYEQYHKYLFLLKEFELLNKQEQTAVLSLVCRLNGKYSYV